MLLNTPVKTARLFKNGQSQAVRLPKAFRFKGDRVLIYREGEKVILQPMKPSWESFFADPSYISDDFLSERDQTLPQERQLF